MAFLVEHLEGSGKRGSGEVGAEVVGAGCKVVGDRGREQLLKLCKSGALVAVQGLVAGDDTFELRLQLALLVHGGEDEVVERSEGVRSPGRSASARASASRMAA